MPKWSKSETAVYIVSIIVTLVIWYGLSTYFTPSEDDTQSAQVVETVDNPYQVKKPEFYSVDDCRNQMLLIIATELRMIRQHLETGEEQWD